MISLMTKYDRNNATFYYAVKYIFGLKLSNIVWKKKL